MDFLQQYYQPQFLKPLDVHDLAARGSKEDRKVGTTTLTDCLRMFEGVEDICEREGLKCDRCRVPTHHTKKMGVARAPPILIIHLKRFKIVNGNKKKID